jgi:pyruvate formate lyase activating enzyme
MQGLLFDLKRDCSEDGPGIRTTLFLKGCPLRCAWCHNPEGIDLAPGVQRHADRCAAQGCDSACAVACGNGALKRRGDELFLDDARCDGCGRCTTACTTGAMEPVGRWMSVDEVLQRVLVDKPFFTATGGGITLSGGEPTVQMKFAGELVRRVKQEGVGTAIETCGAFSYARFAQLLLPWLDHIYFDLKLMDEAEHRRWTGASNRGILANLERLHREAGDRLHVRVPLVPGATATEHNLVAVRRHLHALGIGAVELLPFNPLGADKAMGPAAAAPVRSGFMSVEAQRAAAELLLSG